MDGQDLFRKLPTLITGQIGKEVNIKERMDGLVVLDDITRKRIYPFISLRLNIDIETKFDK